MVYQLSRNVNQNSYDFLNKNIDFFNKSIDDLGEDLADKIVYEFEDILDMYKFA